LGESGPLEPDCPIPESRNGTGAGTDPTANGLGDGRRLVTAGCHRRDLVSSAGGREVDQGLGVIDELTQSTGEAMRITPLDIQQMGFQVKLRGYDRDEVNRFLEEIAHTVESLNRENATLHERITSLEQQVVELKRTETTLSNTLVSAQSLAEDVKRSAQRDSELIIKEAELKAGELFRQARVELGNTQRDLAVLKKQRLLMVERMRATLHTFGRMLDVEASEVYEDHGVLQEEKLENQSSPAR
jgi:cell division initiation protein